MISSTFGSQITCLKICPFIFLLGLCLTFGVIRREYLHYFSLRTRLMCCMVPCHCVTSHPKELCKCSFYHPKWPKHKLLNICGTALTLSPTCYAIALTRCPPAAPRKTTPQMTNSTAHEHCTSVILHFSDTYYCTSSIPNTINTQH